MVERICKLCNEECTDGAERIHCWGPCSAPFHPKCIGFTPVSLKFYKLCESLIFECEDCRDNPYRVMSNTVNMILSIMCILDERLNRQETNSESILKHFESFKCSLQKFENERSAAINMSKEMGKNRTTGSDAERGRTVNDSVVLVRPKNVQKCADTRIDLDRIKIPNNVAISVNNLPNGGIEIQCRSKEDQSKLYEKATKKLGEEYNVIIPKQQKPKIRITNMSEKHNGDDIIASIKNQNELLRDAVMKVLRVYDINYNESYGAIIEVDPKTFKVLMREKKIIIGMNVCDVAESLSVMRCYKCCGYNHKSVICKNKKACLRCGGDHEIKECNAKKMECVNCKRAMERNKLQLDTNHHASSKVCPVLQRNIEKQKLRITYTTQQHSEPKGRKNILKDYVSII